jgi:hypothetical protein
MADMRKNKPRAHIAELLSAMAYPDGQVWPIRHQHWETISKAKKLGLVDDNQYLTDIGHAAIAEYYKGE